jgi:hypothetical protein
MQFEVSSQPQTQFQIQGQNYEQLHMQTQQQTEIKAQPQILTIPQQQPPYIIQGQYYIPPQQQLQPQYQIQVIQQNPNTLEINDSNWFNHMCCLLVWCFIWLIYLISIFYYISRYLGGYYSYLNILLIISVILLIVGIITKKTILYKIGYYIYCVYAVINVIVSIIIGLILLFFLDKYSSYIGLIPTEGQQNSTIQSALDVYKAIIIVALVIQLSIQIGFLKYLKGKFKIFEAYELYARTKENRLIQQPNIV